MMDDDMLTAVHDCLTTARDRVAGEQMARPAAAIISRARRRRLRQGLNTTAAAVIVAVTAVALLLPGSGSYGTTSVNLAAWTVIHKPAGQVSVTIRELRDPAGLQRRLRADGVPASVRFDPWDSQKPPPRHIPHPCYYPLRPNQVDRLLSRIFPLHTSASNQIAFTINPSAIPAGVGLWIEVNPPARRSPGSAAFSVSSILDYASGRCPSRKAHSASGVIVEFFLGVLSHK
jgi:hypothetical protein